MTITTLTIPSNFSFLNDAEGLRFPVESARYSLSYGCQGTDVISGFASIEAAIHEAKVLLSERAEWVTVYDDKRGYAVVKGQN